MNISAAAKASGLPVKTVRYYADIGLVPAPARSEAGDFSIEECRELLGLYQDEDRTSSEVKRIASKRLAQIEEKQKELQSLHDELAHLVKSCRGDHLPDCPIIDYLG